MSYTTVTLLLKQRPHFDTAHGYIIYDAMRIVNIIKTAIEKCFLIL